MIWKLGLGIVGALVAVAALIYGVGAPAILFGLSSWTILPAQSDHVGPC